MSPTAAEAPRFHADRPDDLRRFRPWHRLAYIVRALPAAVERTVPHLGLQRGGRVLDYGSADAPYQRFFDPSIRFVTADLSGNPEAALVLLADGTVPVQDETFDAVLSTQVLEHVGDPALYLRECARVLRPGGRLLLSTHGLMVWHPDPVDHWRWTCSGLQQIVEDAGMTIERFEGVMGLSAAGLQFVQDSVYWRLPRPLRPVFALVVQTLIALCDRFVEDDERRRMNALVFVLVARRG